MLKKIKKIIKHPKIILIYLLETKLSRILSDKFFLKLKYKLMMGKRLNLKNPITFNEKLQWLKLYDRKQKYTNMVDKYEAKKYVANIIGKEYIIPTLGIWEKFEDIDFEKLPNKFVLKCTHDSGGIIICNDKSKIDIKKAKIKIEKCMKRKYYYVHREWPYKNVKPRIIAEKYMANEIQQDLIDYKFFCFNGEPEYMYVSEGMSDHKTAKMGFVDMNYEPTNFYRSDYKTFEEFPEKPSNFNKMVELAKILSRDTYFLRVDFYEINKKIYFSELTFYPNAGYIPFVPIEYDKILGDMINLNN